MRVAILAFVLVGALPLSMHAQEKQPSASDAVLAKCGKILRFGQVNEFYEPSKQDAALALGLLGDDRAVQILVEHLGNEPDGNLRLQIVRALGWIRSPKAAPALEKALKDKYVHVPPAAARALKGITGKEYDFARAPFDPLDFPVFGAPKLPVEVGKSYRFYSTGRTPLFGKDEPAEVLESLGGRWVKLRHRNADSSEIVSLNLAQVVFIVPAPANAEKSK